MAPGVCVILCMGGRAGVDIEWTGGPVRVPSMGVVQCRNVLRWARRSGMGRDGERGKGGAVQGCADGRRNGGRWCGTSRGDCCVWVENGDVCGTMPLK